MNGPGEILVVGSVALDSVRTPYGEAVEALGGSASYFSVAASHFAPVRMVAVVGDDFPAEHRALFAQRDIDTAGLETAPGRTFRWRGEYSAELGHAHTLETQLNVFSSFQPKLERRAPPHALRVPRQHRPGTAAARPVPGAHTATHALRHHELLDRAQA